MLVPAAILAELGRRGFEDTSRRLVKERETLARSVAVAVEMTVSNPAFQAPGLKEARAGLVLRTFRDDHTLAVELLDAQLDVYRGYTSAAAQAKWGTDELAGGEDPSEVVDALEDAATRAGADALNLRVHVPGVTPEMAREQIERLGDEVVAPLRARLA